MMYQVQKRILEIGSSLFVHCFVQRTMCLATTMTKHNSLTYCKKDHHTMVLYTYWTTVMLGFTGVGAVRVDHQDLAILKYKVRYISGAISVCND